MPPKPGKKSPSRSKSPQKKEGNGEATFFGAPLEEENWNVLVNFVVPSGPYDELYLEQLEKSVKTGYRRRFSWLSKKDLIDYVNLNTGKGKAAATKPTAGVNVGVILPQYQAILDQIRPLLDNKEEIPDNLMAPLVKGRLMQMKAIEKEKEAARLAREGGADKKSVGKGAPAAGGKAKSPTGKKSPAKAAAPKKQNTGPLPEIEKTSQLKKKEDIEDEEKFADDEPKDGPNHYIILSGFYSPTFFNLIDEYSIPIDCLMKFKTSNPELIGKFMAEIEEREKLETNLKANLKLGNESVEKNPINVQALSEERQAHIKKVKLELENFWGKVNSILEKPDSKKLIQNIARSKLSLKNDPRIKSWFELEARAEFSQEIFNQLAEGLYSLVIQKRQYGFYMKNLKLYAIPQATKQIMQTMNLNANQLNDSMALGMPPSQPSQVECDMRYYNELVSTLPAEYLSTSLILHCMIEQVVASSEEKLSPVVVDETTASSNKNSPRIQNLSSDVSNCLSNMISNLALEDKEKQNLTHLLSTPRNEKIEPDAIKKKTSSISPYLINYSDDIAVRLKGVLDDNSQKKTKRAEKLSFDPIKVETDMLAKSMWTVFTGLPSVSAKLAKERAARLQELLHFCSSPEITNADVDRALKQFVFETMNLTDVTKKNSIKKNENNIVVPWDDPYPNITATLSEKQQIHLKSLNLIEAQELNEELKKHKANTKDRASSASTTKSIKFNDEINDSDQKNELPTPSSILKSRSSTKLSVQSVHFPDSFELNPDQLNDIVAPKTIDQTIEMINNTKKRDLTDWNLAEHYDPKILVQVLQKASYTHPYVDSYYNRRDNSLMLVFSNPFDESSLSNHEEWNIKLHSDVGFRNYLEKIYEMIIEWTRDEEAKYQANLVTKEVDKFSSDSKDKDMGVAGTTGMSPSASRASMKSKQSPSPDKGKKGKATAAAAQPPPPANDGITSHDADNYITDKFISHNSLKAWKIEHDKEMADNAKNVKAPPKPKSPKGGKTSPSKGNKSPATAITADKDKKKSPSRPKSTDSTSSKAGGKKGSPTRDGSAKGKKTSRSNSKTKPEPEKPAPPAPTVLKANNPFVGYDVGNNMVYVKSYLNHMFPSNGSLIKTERHVHKTSQKVFITTSVIKDGNIFSMHLIDPKTADDDKTKNENKGTTNEIHSSRSNISENKDNKGIANHTSFTGVFVDGLTMSYSSQSITPKIKKVVLPAEVSPRNVPEVAPAPVVAEKKDDKKAAASKKGKKDSTPEPVKKIEEVKKVETEVPVKVVEVAKEEPPIKILPWSQLHLSLPTGLSCTFVPETYAGIPAKFDNQPHQLIVKQSYSSRCNEKSTEHFKNFNPQTLKEKSRIIKSDGTVIKFMNDNSIEIFYANGTIYRKVEEIVNEPEHELTPEAEQALKEKAKLKEKEKSTDKKKDINKSEDMSHVEHVKTIPKWTVITPSGNFYSLNKEEKKHELVRHYRNIQATDPQSGETMITREDNLKMVYRTDGSSLVEYEDGTRITMFYVYSDTNLNDDETGEMNKKREKYVKIECPGFATTIFNSKSTECTIAFGTGTLVACDPKKMSYNLIYHTGEILDINKNGVICMMPKSTSTDNSRNKYIFDQNSDIILDHEDEAGNRFKVNKIGKHFILAQNNNKQKGLIKKYQRHAPRFFVIHKDSSGTELLRYEDVNEYLSEVEIDPMTAIIRDSVQGFPNIMGTTILRPLKNCLTDHWLSEYDEKDITPFGLRCRNLLSFPPNPEIKVPGPRFATNLGRGINIDQKQLSRVKNPALTIAKRMEYRQLIEYNKLSEEIKAQLVAGLKNYMIYVAERAENHRLLLTHDPRTETEKLTAYKILQLARPDHLLNADITNLYRNTLAKNSIDYTGKSLKGVNKLIISNKTVRDKKLKEELDKEKVDKESWKKTFVPVYFQSEWGKNFLEGIPNKESNFLQTSENLFMQNTTEDNSLINLKKQAQVKLKMDEPPKVDTHEIKPKKDIRVKENQQENKDKINSQSNVEKYKPQFKHIDKLDPKKLPNSIKTTRPNAMPNELYLSTEEPFRRKVHTSIVQAAKLNGKPLEKRRGCDVYPSQINFGILREGFTYVVDFELINVGIDACRFKIKQPPPESGMKVMYKPGPIAAGMSRDLSIICLAIYKMSENSTVEQISPRLRNLKHNLEITTETDMINLPIEADIATSEEYRSMFRGNLDAGKGKNVRVLSVRPGSTKEVLTKSFKNESVILSNEYKSPIEVEKETN